MDFVNAGRELIVILRDLVNFIIGIFKDPIGSLEMGVKFILAWSLVFIPSICVVLFLFYIVTGSLRVARVMFIIIMIFVMFKVILVFEMYLFGLIVLASIYLVRKLGAVV